MSIPKNRKLAKNNPSRDKDESDPLFFSWYGII